MSQLRKIVQCGEPRPKIPSPSFLAGGALQLHGQPGPRESPVTHDGLRRNAERFRGFVNAEAAEEPQFDHFRTSWILSREHTECIVQRAEFSCALSAGRRQ